MKSPMNCHSMPELREQIDTLDGHVVALLAARARYIDRAIMLKSQTGLPARIDGRVEEVVKRVRSRAKSEGLEPDLIEALWRQLIDWSIAREEAVLNPSASEE